MLSPCFGAPLLGNNLAVSDRRGSHSCDRQQRTEARGARGDFVRAARAIGRTYHDPDGGSDKDTAQKQVPLHLGPHVSGYLPPPNIQAHRTGLPERDRDDTEDRRSGPGPL